MTKYMIEIFIATAALVTALVFATSWWAVAAGIAGMFLGFGVFRYILASRIYGIALRALQPNTAEQEVKGHG